MGNGLLGGVQVRCRACKKDKLYKVIDKGITLLFCKSCALLQNADIVPVNKKPKSLKNVVDRVLSKVALRMEDVVVDILAQDGGLLKHYPKELIRIGFDPQYQGRYKGVNMVFVGRWFTEKVYKAVFEQLGVHKDKLAKVITAVDVINQISNPYTLIKDVSHVLDPDGVFVIEDNYIGDMIGGSSIPTQNSYFSLYALERLLHTHGLEVFDIEGFKVFIRHMSTLRKTRVAERDLGLNNQVIYTLWGMKLRSR